MGKFMQKKLSIDLSEVEPLAIEEDKDVRLIREKKQEKMHEKISKKAIAGGYLLLGSKIVVTEERKVTALMMVQKCKCK